MPINATTKKQNKKIRKFLQKNRAKLRCRGLQMIFMNETVVFNAMFKNLVTKTRRKSFGSPVSWN